MSDFSSSSASLATTAGFNLDAATSAAALGNLKKANQAAGGQNSLTSLGAKPIDMDKVSKSAEQFEAVFLGQMLQPMFEGLKTDSLFGGGHGEDMFRSMMVTQYGNQLAASGGIGLADQVKAEMIRMQEKLTPSIAGTTASAAAAG